MRKIEISEAEMLTNSLRPKYFDTIDKMYYCKNNLYSPELEFWVLGKKDNETILRLVDIRNNDFENPSGVGQIVYGDVVKGMFKNDEHYFNSTITVNN